MEAQGLARPASSPPRSYSGPVQCIA